MFSLCYFEFSVDIGAFVIRMSQIASFLLNRQAVKHFFLQFYKEKAKYNNLF